MAAPVLNPEEYQYTDTGTLLNGDSTLPFVDITAVSGLDSAPARVSSTTRDDTYGGWVDAVYEDIRTVSIEGTIYAVSNSLDDYLDTLKANFAVGQGTQPLYFGTDSDTRMVLGKSLGLQYDKDAARRLGTINFQAQIMCEDPRIFSVTPVSMSLPGTLHLDGNRNTVGTIKIASGSPTITVNGSTFTFTSAVPAATTIDLGQRTILTADGTNVRPSVTITGGWPLLQAGDNVFTGSGGGITVTANGAWR